jgi:hypothetical protein
MKLQKPLWGLVRRRECVLPTLRGWLLLVVVGTLLVIGAVRNVHPFLAVTDPVPSEVLVVEGWTPDYALEEAIAEFRRHHCSKLYVVGGPLEQGAFLSEYKTYAELGAATLMRMGLNRDAVQAVPRPAVRRDRTYASAVALKRWLQEHDAMPTSLNVMSVAAHSRRSWLLFHKAFGEGSRVGIVAVEDRDYDAKHWWRYSEGVRVVTGEVIAYCYARLFFRPAEE